MSDDEKDLTGSGLGKTVGGAVSASLLVAAASRTKPGWQRNLLFTFAIVAGLATVVGLIGQVMNFNSLPACDAQQTRDTLSDLNNSNKFNATKYNFIKTVSTSDTEVLCTANLALKGGSNVEYDYRIYRDGGVKVKITEVRK